MRGDIHTVSAPDSACSAAHWGEAVCVQGLRPGFSALGVPPEALPERSWRCCSQTQGPWQAKRAAESTVDDQQTFEEMTVDDQQTFKEMTVDDQQTFKEMTVDDQQTFEEMTVDDQQT